MQHSEKPTQQQLQLDGNDITSILEALLFVSGEAVQLADIASALALPLEAVEAAVERLMSAYDYNRRGLQIIRFADKVQMSTRKEYSDIIERFAYPNNRQTLSQSAIETLSIIAYRQPITRAEVEQVRGVRCEYTISSLVSKGLICDVGRKETLGRPILYGTTDAFLRYFALESLEDLPHRAELLSVDMPIDEQLELQEPPQEPAGAALPDQQV
nr:SMC-Scp complex subunit ScpB [Maliibacterium massiliense]